MSKLTIHRSPATQKALDILDALEPTGHAAAPSEIVNAAMCRRGRRPLDEAMAGRLDEAATLLPHQGILEMADHTLQVAAATRAQAEALRVKVEGGAYDDAARRGEPRWEEATDDERGRMIQAIRGVYLSRAESMDRKAVGYFANAHYLLAALKGWDPPIGGTAFRKQTQRLRRELNEAYDRFWVRVRELEDAGEPPPAHDPPTPPPCLAPSAPVLTGPAKYGGYYWCIKSDQSGSGEIYAHADRVEVTAGGDLVLWRERDGRAPETNLALARGQWSAVYAASCIDGSAVAVEHWQGEVDRE